VRILLLNQAFHPDHVGTAQALTDVALALIADGHDVSVIASDRAYDDPAVRFHKRESWRGVDVHRVGVADFGKRSRLGRALSFATFLSAAAVKLAMFPRVDVIVALTSPPLVSVLGAVAARVKRSRFVFWVMDLNPDEAVAAGWLKRSSLAARVLDRMLRASLNAADIVVALDPHMAEIIAAKGTPLDRIAVLSPWAFEAVRFDAAARMEFRRAHNWTDKFVVMYAGNHSPCNPLDTIVRAAERLSHDKDVIFCFMGGGSVHRDIQRASSGQRETVAVLDYQPRESLAGALSAADLHVVTMGDGFTGLIHPSKIYNVLAVGAPFLYVGPKESHVNAIARALPHSSWCVAHGDVTGALDAIAAARARKLAFDRAAVAETAAPFRAGTLIPRLVSLVVDGSGQPAGPVSKPVRV
jgi:glycosyltransferase involved in cell wall biosynthesis